MTPSHSDYHNFIDWMKCFGIMIIVFGHVSGTAINLRTPPVYPKQFGVAFFLFVMGYGLAHTKKPLQRILWSRLFDVYLVGVFVALLISAIKLSLVGHANPSNYLPFMIGVNVLFNSFPANPTTWYIGTYIHLLFLWAFIIRRINITPWLLLFFAAVEILARAILMKFAGEYIAYMFITNWLTVFLAGCLYGKKASTALSNHYSRIFAALFLLLAFWFFAAGFLGFDQSFPFRHLSASDSFLQVLAISGMITLVYITAALCLFGFTLNLKAPAMVRFISRNSLIIFIAHMPLFYWLNPLFQQIDMLRTVHLYPIINFLVEFSALAVVSELIMQTWRVSTLKEHVYRKLFNGNIPAISPLLSSK
jgi:peptidoglycan/LPS O-acetylase OafA/YrhL